MSSSTMPATTETTAAEPTLARPNFMPDPRRPPSPIPYRNASLPSAIAETVKERVGVGIGFEQLEKSTGSGITTRSNLTVFSIAPGSSAAASGAIQVGLSRTRAPHHGPKQRGIAPLPLQAAARIICASVAYPPPPPPNLDRALGSPRRPGPRRGSDTARRRAGGRWATSWWPSTAPASRGSTAKP